MTFDLRCPGNSLHADIIGFGLADKNNTIVGQGLEARVTTMEKCKFGQLPDLRKEWNIMESFDKECAGKSGCNFTLDFPTFFSQECTDEVRRRIDGNHERGPNRVYF